MPKLKKKWLRQQIEDLHRGVNFLRKKISNEALHETRVAIKAIKAVLLQQGIAKAEFQNRFAAISYLFKSCAACRDYRLIDKKLNSIPAYNWCTPLKKQLKSQVSLADKKLHDYICNKKKYNKVLDTIADIAKQSETLLLPLTPLKQASHPLYLPKQKFWHDWRKNIKKFTYVSAATGSYSNVAHKTIIQALQHNIGEWHDWQNTLQWTQKNADLCTSANYSLLKQQATSRVLYFSKEIEQLANELQRPPTSG